MNQILGRCKKLLTGNGGLTLVALAVLLTVGLMPQWVSAHDGEPSTFTSPLDGPPHGAHNGIDAELRETLDAIIDREAVLAEVLGISVEELAAAQESGVSLHELIDQAGLDPKTVHEEIQNAVDAAVQQAVEEGLLTQEQADLVLNPPARPENDGDHGQGPHREHGRPEGDDPDSDDTDSDEASDDTTTPVADSEAEDTTTDGATTTETEGEPDTHHSHHNPDAQNNDEATSDTEDASVNNHRPDQQPREQGEGNRRPGR